MWGYDSNTRYRAEGYSHTIWVLLWKHARERKHSICHTIWEILSGVLVFGVFFMVSQTFRDKGSVKPQMLVDSKTTYILYKPENDFNKMLMKRVSEKLKYFNVSISTDSISGFQNENDLIDFVKSIQKYDIVVIDFQDNKSSNYFKYSIGKIGPRLKSELYLMLNGYLEDTLEEHPSPLLGKLQWAIDSAYMEQLVENNFTHDIKLQAPEQHVSKKLYVMQSFIILCTIVAPLPFFLYNSSRLIVERRSGLKELMKMMSVSTKTLRFAHLLDTAFIGVFYATLITILLKMTSNPILAYSNGVIIALTLLLHFVNVVSLGFITSALSQDFNHADSLAMLIYMCTFMLDNILHISVVNNKAVLCLICCVLPHAPMYVFWDEIITWEEFGEGSRFSNIFKSNSDELLPVAAIWLFMCIHQTFNMAIAWYVDLIRPGRYGIPKKWTFLFENKFWSSKRKQVTFHVTSEKSKVLRDDRFFEKAPKRVEVAIKVLKVTKIFRTYGKPDVLALDEISLDIYKGEVTVLLGANGAGKTTLLYVITGMYSSTNGKVYINGINIADRIQELRKDFGLCPQNNITFENLTVRENIRFFEMLKSVNLHQRSSAEELMRKLKLLNNANDFSHQLCTGKQKSLQVACALAGGSDVLVLDEPTSGMDPECRHCLWDIIMELRGHRTVLLSTSCLEEADALGDRIALLNNGRLRCHGRPQFLKQAIGAGFNLSITFRRSKYVDNVRNLVEDTIPEVTSKMFEDKRVIFKLPMKEKEKFPLLFDLLEERKKELGITLVELGMFMEEIFLGFIDQEIDNDLVTESSLRNIHEDRLAGYNLLLQRLKVLISRTFFYMWRKKTQFIILQILIPMVSLIIATVTTNAAFGYGMIYKSRHSALSVHRLIYNMGPYRTRDVLNNLMINNPKIYAVNGKEININAKTPQTIGFEMSENVSSIFYPIDSQEMISKAVNIFSNVYMSLHLPYLTNYTIDTRYDNALLRTSKDVVIPKTLYLCVQWALWIVFLSVLPLAPHVLLSIREFASGTRHHHYMAGCSPLVHWSSKMIAQLSLYTALIPVTVLLVALVLDFDRTLGQFKYLGCVTALLLVFGPAFLAHIYLLSFLLHKNNATSILYIITLVFGIVAPIFLYVLRQITRVHTWLEIPCMLLTVISYCSPVYALGVGLCRLTSLARLNAYCYLNKHLCPKLLVEDLMFVAEECCESSSDTPYGYFVSHGSGLCDFLILIAHFLVYSIIVLLIEYKTIVNVFTWFTNYFYKEPQQAYDDPRVIKEIEYVKTKIEHHDFTEDVLLAYNLHKGFVRSSITKHVSLVRGISLAAKYGECICILGPNGAGKKTLLRMLAAYMSMTRGFAYVGGQSIKNNRSEYLQRVYLMSSVTSLDDFLSGYQNLVLMSKLQGYTNYSCHRLSRQMLNFMGLNSLSNIHLSKYSVGCSWRLALCAGMLASPQVALLEAPMSAVDPYTRPLLARALRRLLDDGVAAVVTENSLERSHMELIFDRVAIMFGGQFAALGTVEEVNASLAMGYSVKIKLRMVIAYKIKDNVGDNKVLVQTEEPVIQPTQADDSEGREPDEMSIVRDGRQTNEMYDGDVRDLKMDMRAKFPTSELTNEHSCILYYYIQDFEKQMQYSKMFTIMEQLRERYQNLIEDYTLSVATVEEVYENIEKQNLKKIIIDNQRRREDDYKSRVVPLSVPEPSSSQ